MTRLSSRRPAGWFAIVAAAGTALAVLTGCGSSDSAGRAPVSLPATVGPAQASATASPDSGSGVASPSSAAVTAQDPVAAEDNPPGDIPDNLAFVMYRNEAGRYEFTHPEGWTERANGPSVLFTDKLNGVQVTLGTRSAPADEQAARATDVPALEGSQPAFELRTVSTVSVGSARGVKIVYRRNSEPDDVTGRQYRDEVERYELVSGGRELVVELFGPVGADNVDAYRTMIESLRFA